MHARTPIEAVRTSMPSLAARAPRLEPRGARLGTVAVLVIGKEDKGRVPLDELRTPPIRAPLVPGG